MHYRCTDNHNLREKGFLVLIASYIQKLVGSNFQLASGLLMPSFSGRILRRKIIRFDGWL
jgi:hypothetical protein